MVLQLVTRDTAEWVEDVDLDDFELVYVDVEDALRLVATRRPALGEEHRSRWDDLQPLLERRRFCAT